MTSGIDPMSEMPDGRTAPGTDSAAGAALNALGLVLAGGEGRRMGGNKPFRQIGGRALVAHAIDIAQRQCRHVVISSNAGADMYRDYPVAVIADIPEPGHGPLAGVLAGLSAMPAGMDWLVTFPVDCPILPDDLAGQLIAAADQAGVLAAYARHAGRDHYLSSAWHRDAAPVIADMLDQDERRVRGPLKALDAVAVDFDSGTGIGAGAGTASLFANANTIEELALLEAAMTGRIVSPS